MREVLRLLYPEGERVSRRSLEKWEKDLSSKLFCSMDRFELDKSGWKDEFLLIINQSSLMAVFLGQNDLAYKICFSGINFFMDVLWKVKKEKYIEGIFQPWINIGRLRIIEKKFSEAHKIFDKCSPFKEVYNINGYRVFKKDVDNKIINLLKNCFFYEKMKIYLGQKNLNGILNFCKHNEQEFVEYSELFLDAKILAMIQEKKYSLILDRLVNFLPNIRHSFLPIFLLRVVDLNILLNKPIEESKNLLLHLFNQHNDYINGLNLQGLHFCLEICRRLKNLNMMDRFECMIGKLIEKYESVNEEVGLIESLELAKDLSDIYKIRFNNIIAETKYIFLRKKYLNEDVTYDFSLGKKLVCFLEKGVA